MKDEDYVKKIRKEAEDFGKALKEHIFNWKKQRILWALED